jgi:hypothetical protein
MDRRRRKRIRPPRKGSKGVGDWKKSLAIK